VDLLKHSKSYWVIFNHVICTTTVIFWLNLIVKFHIFFVVWIKCQKICPFCSESFGLKTVWFSKNYCYFALINSTNVLGVIYSNIYVKNYVFFFQKSVSWRLFWHRYCSIHRGPFILILPVMKTSFIQINHNSDTL